MSAACLSSGLLPSARPNRCEMSCSQKRSRSSKVVRSAQVEILTSSAKPFRTCDTGKVRRKVKSRKVWIGAW